MKTRSSYQKAQSVISNIEDLYLNSKIAERIVARELELKYGIQIPLPELKVMIDAHISMMTK